MNADDGSLPCKEGEEEALLAYRRLFELDQYYHLLAGTDQEEDKSSSQGTNNKTFETRFVEVSMEECKAWREWNRGAALDSSQQRHIDALKTRLETAIQHFVRTSPAHAAFVRLSTRSPKDAVDKVPGLIPILREQLQQEKRKCEEAGDREYGGNERLVGLRRAFMRVMAVTNADEALQLIMYSSRAISDIKRALDFADKSSWNLKLIVREFVEIPIEGEFRGFVYNNKLNALSQYYADCFFPEIASETQKKKIEERVLTFFEQEIKDSLKHLSSYIVDFVVTDKYVKVVELNPFSKSTGACLFDWDKDKQIIEEGPFEFRVNTKEREGVHAMLMPWRYLIQAAETESTSKEAETDNEKEPRENEEDKKKAKTKEKEKEKENESTCVIG
jgi:hypothetical protein